MSSATTLASPSPVAMALTQIELLAKEYASARAALHARTVMLNDAVRAIYRQSLPRIKSAADDAAGCQSRLVAAIQAHPELFERPRTMTLHGIKLGFKKGAGCIEWADDEKLAARILTQLGEEQFEVLVKTTHKPLASALKNLDVTTLRKLGCTVEETGDAVFVKAATSAVDKLVEKILKEGSVEEAEAA